MSATTGASSRSPSPATSESLSDEQHNTDTLDFSAWCNLSPEPISESDGTPWNAEEQQDLPKMEESSLRMLEEMLRVQSQPFDPITPESAIGVNPSVFHLSQPQSDDKGAFSSSAFSNFSSDNSSSESAPVPELTARTTLAVTMPTRVIPPPPVQPRKVDYSAHRRVIFPAKESCYNLAILTPNIPPCGTKSRVETQVRVALDLALPSGSSGDPSSYDRVGSWKWLKLPAGTATRKRSRKEGKIDASPIDTLFMDAEVTCASYPSKQVQSCSTCQGREAKRVARKIAARVRPARSDSDSNDGEGGSSSKIVQFNCPDTLDFSGGSVVLPLRITCYCRHHREKLGFNVHFTMRDASGRIIGKGMSPPIMITDDHKSTDKSTSKQPSIPSYLSETDWNTRAALDSIPREAVAADSGPPSRRRQPMPRESSGASKKRAKPYDSGRTRRGDSSQPTVDTGTSPSSPSISDASILTPFSPFAPSIFTRGAPTSPESLQRESITSLPSPPNSNQSPVSPQIHFMENTDAIMQDVLQQQSYHFIPLSPPETAPSSPPSASASSSLDLPSFAFNILHSSPDPPAPSLPSPKIHRLIPAAGPTFGGIEVTVLGSNFHPSVLHNCVFGDVTASSTTRWSENTLVCILPPRATAGVVQVTLEGLKMDSSGAPALFTYLDETDRNLMELALQVVGLKMTGKIEDAKDIAMRIVGTSSQDSQSNSGSTTQIMNLASGALPDSRRLLLSRGDDAEFEKTIMDSLLSLDMRGSTGEPISLTPVISHPTKTGQTLLHLAALLKFSSLVEFLIQRDISLDAQDINGYTALHFAVLSGSPCCARQIINAGADVSICSKMGYTAFELAPDLFLDPVQETTDSEESDEESHFGDIEEDSGNEGRPLSRVHSRRRVRHPRSRRSSKPASIASDASDEENLFDSRAAAEDDDNATVVSPESLPIPGKSGKDTTIDEKQAATFAEYLQRAWAQFQPPHLRPQMPNMPQLPGMPAWVFPVFVPMQAWPPFRTERHEEGNDEKHAASSPRAHWESFMAQMSAAMARQGQLGESALDADEPRKPSVLADQSSESHEETTKLPFAPAPVASRSLLRRFGYNQTPIEVSEKEVKSYSYRPKTKSLAKPVNKEDRMLIIFWIPIMILVLGWALYASRHAISMLQQFLPWEDVTRRFSAIV